MKEYVFGFKLAAALENNFKNTFSSASNQILKLNEKMKEYNNITSACSSAVKQGSLSVDSYNNALNKVYTSYSKLSANAQRYLKIQGQINQRRVSMGQNESNVLHLAGLAYGFAKPMKAAIEFESSMSDVRKVVDFDTPEQFKVMSQDILDLSKRIPMTAQGLASIVASGGQAGIAKEDLLRFAESAAKMGTAFDVSADQAGEMMAKWRTAFKMNQNDVVALADKINYLSNKTAASAPLISDVVTRIGPLGEVGGVASGEIAALGASLVGSGIQSEVAATGIKNLILTMVSGESASKGQKEAFSKLGFSASEMASRMQKDAKGAIVDVLGALENLDKEEQGATLQKLFGKESIGAIAPLLSNLEGLQKNLNMVADSSQYAGSMQGEFDTKAQTTANQLMLMKNELVALETEIGNGILPAFRSMLQTITPFAKTLSDFVSKNSEFIGTMFLFASGIAATGAVLNAAAWAGNGFVLALSGVKGAYVATCIWAAKHEVATKLSTVATKLSTAATNAWSLAKTIGIGILKADTVQFMIAATRMGLHATATGIMTAAQWALNASFLACPITWIIGGLIALVAAGYLLVKNWDTVKQWFTTLWDNPTLALQQFVTGIKTMLGDAWNWIKEKWDSIGKLLSTPIFGKVNIAAEGVKNGQAPARNALGGIYNKGAFLTTFAENSGESAIPHTPNARNIGLLAKTNEIMGNPLGGNNISVNFAPVINASGSADTAAIQNAIADERRKLETMLRDLMNQQRRLSYA